MNEHAIATTESGQVEEPRTLQSERLAFTGTLASMTHREAQQLTSKYGGVATTSVSRQTTMLVVGEEGWPLEPDGKTSLKLRQVTAWQREGMAVKVIKESDWLGLLGLDDRRKEVHRRYTPAMLSQLLDVPVNVIRGWERSGLIKPVRRIFRLPYFDFQEVAGARRLAELLAAGVDRAEIEASLARLHDVLPGIERPLIQLEILAHDHKVLYRDAAGLLEPTTGQRLLDFELPVEPPSQIDDPPALPDAAHHVQTHWKADDWFDQACRHLEENELDAAIEAFRLCLIDDPDRPDVNFQLAETLYRLGKVDAALERYHVAVELDHNYLEAWTQLGCLHAEQGQRESALEAFDVALDVHPDYPDAHLHKAELLQQLGRTEQAIKHWQTYLRFDTRGPWAESARRRLEEAGETVN